MRLTATTDGASEGVAARSLLDERLLHELEQLHRTRHETFLYGSDEALRHHTERSAELEAEYLRRFPNRLVTAGRTRSGARAREAAARIEATPR
ncbi:DUF6158 family protein [Kitasatospora sp. NBC_01287]|uniref:DUF6158 family protein n=1 Tax=Kitasatospora sp. NBC_01287 TaxID=2903573 RepID=UPI00225A5681|nr:DUF6158 family protein [Kitasatospora sp. NBC_01287]MCX4750828.1 DUF6158 family protein [Kitasatospora sp. NBC_01287]